MSYREIAKLDHQLENSAKDSEESYALIRRIAKVVQDFCDEEAHKYPDTEIIWNEWEFSGRAVVIQATEYSLDRKEYDSLMADFEEYLDTEIGTEYCQQNPWGVSTSYENFRDQATNIAEITLVMK